MTISLTIDELEEAISARIALLDSTPYQQAGAPSGEMWRESDVPLTVSTDSVLQAHLAYSVSVEDAPVLDDGHASEGYLSVQAQVAVVFFYRLRTDDQRRDQRTAIRAARAVMSAVMAPSATWGSAMPITIYQPQALVAEFLPIRQSYSCLIDVPIGSV